ncbi:MAG: hypothetical protein AB7P04_02670 [Bacteriovoracia bacterium]
MKRTPNFGPSFSLLLCFALAMPAPTSVQADDSPDCDAIKTMQAAAEERKLPIKEVPQETMKPGQIGKEVKVAAFGCKREFVHQEKTYPIDSFHKQDGERLRPVIQEVPSAVAQLNAYQRNRRAATTANYVGTIGIGVALVGLILGRQLSGDTAVVVRNISVLSGLAMTSGSLIYRFTILRSNENHLTQAVQNYNSARPNDSIQLQFSTEMFF